MKKEIKPLNEKREPVLANKNGKAEIVSYTYSEEDVKEANKNLKKELKEFLPDWEVLIESKFEKHIGEMK